LRTVAAPDRGSARAVEQVVDCSSLEALGAQPCVRLLDLREPACVPRPHWWRATAWRRQGRQSGREHGFARPIHRRGVITAPPPSRGCGAPAERRRSPRARVESVRGAMPITDLLTNSHLARVIARGVTRSFGGAIAAAAAATSVSQPCGGHAVGRHLASRGRRSLQSRSHCRSLNRHCGRPKRSLSGCNMAAMR